MSVYPARKYRLILLFSMAALLYFIANLQKVIIPGSIFNELQHQFHASASGIAGVGAAFMYTYAAFQLVIGLLADRYCGSRVILAGGFLLGAGSLICGASSSLWQLYAGRILLSMAAASIYLSLVKETSRIFPKNFPLMLGIAMLVGYSGGIAGNTPFIAGVHKVGWQWMMVYIGVGTLLIYAVFAALSRTLKFPSVNKAARLDIRRFPEALRIRHNRCLIGTTSTGFAVYFSVQTLIGKKFLEDFFHLNASQAGYVMSVTMAIAAGNCLLTPIFSRLCGNRRRIFVRFMGFCSLFCTLSLLLTVFWNCRKAWLGIAVIWLLSFCSNMSPVSAALFRETNKSGIYGVTMSVSNFFAYLATALFSNLAGVLMDLFPPRLVNGIKIYGRDSYLAVFCLLLAGSAVAAWSSLHLMESKGQDISDRVR